MPVGEALVALWTSGAWLGSAFAGGVVGNLVASVIAGTTRWISQPLLARVPDLARLLSTGGRGSNHDILRALRRAECAVTVALCDQALLDDHGLRTGQGPLVEQLRSRLRERQDPDVAAICRIRREFRRTWEDLKTLPAKELARLHGTALSDVATLIKAGSECLSAVDPDDLRRRVVQMQLDGLEAVVKLVPPRMGLRGPEPRALAPDGLPESLGRRFEQHPNGWWDFLRLAFREELKDPENERARIAWQLDILSLLPQLLGRDHAAFEQRVATVDARIFSVWSDLIEFRPEFDRAIFEVTELLGELLDEVRGTRAEMHDRFDRVEALVRARPSPRPRQLPPRAFAREFFGRKELLADLTDRLRRREDVCIWGPAGMGKTALAAEAIRAVVGDTDDSLADSPYPDGVVLLDLYHLHGDQTAIWDRLAAAFEPAARTDRPARERAEDACRGRRALVVVEGAEEAGSGQALRDPLFVVAPETTRLVLTRNTAQVFTASPLQVAAELDRADAVSLLTKLTEGRIAESILVRVIDHFGGHPLALTWAGSQLASGDEAPSAFLQAPGSVKLHTLHEPGYERHTLHWLYERSVAHVSEDARLVLAGLAWLAPTSIPLSAPVAILAEGRHDDAERAGQALKTLVRHGLLRLRTGADEQWEFSHSLVYRYARETRSDRAEILDRLSRWAHGELDAAAAHARHSGDLAPLTLLIQHAIELLLETAKGLEAVAATLLYGVQDDLNALGRTDLARATLQAVLGWMNALPLADRDLPARQRDRSIALLRIGDVWIVQGQVEAARVAYEEGLTVVRGLAGVDPGNADWQRDLSARLTTLAELSLAMGRHDVALSFAEESLVIGERLATLDPSNAVWQKDVRVSRALVARLRSQQA